MGLCSLAQGLRYYWLSDWLTDTSISQKATLKEKKMTTKTWTRSDKTHAEMLEEYLADTTSVGAKCRHTRLKNNPTDVKIVGDTAHITTSSGVVYKTDADNPFLSMIKQVRWCPKGQGGYAGLYIGATGKTIYLHRVLMNTPPRLHTDHADHDVTNNMRSNARPMTASANRRNTDTSGYSSQFWGVCRVPSETNPWSATIRIGGKKTGLGVYPDEVSAARAFDRAIDFYGVNRRKNGV